MIARLLRACFVDAPDDSGAKAAGELLAASHTSDIVDASVVVGAPGRSDAILTSDPKDLRDLARSLDEYVTVTTPLAGA